MKKLEFEGQGESSPWMLYALVITDRAKRSASVELEAWHVEKGKPARRRALVEYAPTRGCDERLEASVARILAPAGAGCDAVSDASRRILSHLARTLGR